MRALLMAGAAVIGLTGAVNAAQIASGSQLSINGFYGLLPQGATIGSATGIDFTNGSGYTPGVPGVLSGASGNSGSFLSLPTCNTGNCGTIQDVPSFASFSPTTGFFALTYAGSGNLSFDATSLSVTQTTLQGVPTLNFVATGTLNWAGYTSTAAQFAFTTVNTTSRATFASITITQPSSVPEPMTLALVGSSLAGLGLLRRRRQR